jgi:hypothetical protein
MMNKRTKTSLLAITLLMSQQIMYCDDSADNTSQNSDASVVTPAPEVPKSYWTWKNGRWVLVGAAALGAGALAYYNLDALQNSANAWRNKLWSPQDLANAGLNPENPNLPADVAVTPVTPEVAPAAPQRNWSEFFGMIGNNAQKEAQGYGNAISSGLNNALKPVEGYLPSDQDIYNAASNAANSIMNNPPLPANDSSSDRSDSSSDEPTSSMNQATPQQLQDAAAGAYSGAVSRASNAASDAVNTARNWFFNQSSMNNDTSADNSSSNAEANAAQDARLQAQANIAREAAEKANERGSFSARQQRVKRIDQERAHRAAAAEAAENYDTPLSDTM